MSPGTPGSGFKVRGCSAAFRVGLGLRASKGVFIWINGFGL